MGITAPATVGVTLELMFAGESHTNNDILVSVPQERMLLAGDLFRTSDSPCARTTHLVDVPTLVARVAYVSSQEGSLATIIPANGARFGAAALTGLPRQIAEQWSALGDKRSAALALGTMIEAGGTEAARAQVGQRTAAKVLMILRAPLIGRLSVSFRVS